MYLEFMLDNDDLFLCVCVSAPTFPMFGLDAISRDCWHTFFNATMYFADIYIYKSQCIRINLLCTVIM